MGLLTLLLTFAPHAHFDALLVAAVLALVAVVLIDGTVAAAAARVRQVATHRALEEGLATCVAWRRAQTPGGNVVVNSKW